MSELVDTFISNSYHEPHESHKDIAKAFLELMDEFNFQISFLQIPPPVSCVYNPTIYARYPFELYIHKYCNTPKKIMYLGMNPGPWGMSQTGVPFGEVNAVRDWLRIEGPVMKPNRELPARPVLGFQSTRSEISGQRFWGLFKELCETPQNFFRTSFVHNYMPQQWMKENGCNVTPSDFKAHQLQLLYNICDPLLCRIIELLDAEVVVAIGRFCQTRAVRATRQYLPDKQVKVLYLPHPSPRVANKDNWHETAHRMLQDYGITRYYDR